MLIILGEISMSVLLIRREQTQCLNNYFSNLIYIRVYQLTYIHNGVIRVYEE